ncbi:aspartate aminotransferase [Candidatus Shapirobacteria bacterium CG09_land_8_20_14_0_10_47_13]|uniref:Aminotransferase n=1 Tax=Candidatus Shapirobacteria bacterium CG09_land_8_20_14_0_10_47_13 TaxID=1974481 RepID=A0A2H0WN52_9BACT|nr:MAG: aspartate aminotransferase [Candidatus Shapirobacteria bacterium CG09_land_8_20_14_0_10_47_13]
MVKRIEKLSPSPTLALDAKVKLLQAKGIKIINLALGEPDFETPLSIKRAAIKAIKDGFTHYTATSGISELKEAICRKLKRENNLDYQTEEIIVSVGSKQALFNAFMALCDKGDEVLVPIPTWSTYVEQIKLAEGKPVLIPLREPFKLTAKDLLKKISPKTRILILNNPANPTGAVIEKSELEEIAKIAVSKNIWIISDEIYEKIIYGIKHFSIASLNGKIKNKTITINGLSKSYAMTGWRVGYAAGPQEIIKAMEALQSQTTSNTSSISQMAAVEALEGSPKDLRLMVKEFQKRRQFICQKLSEIKSLSFTVPEGAFYVFVNIGKKDSASWCEKLLEKEQVAVVPGEAFLHSGYFRLSFALSLSNLKEGVKRIRSFCQNDN